MRLLKSPYLLMALAMLFWAGNWLLARALRADVTPTGLNFWRWTVALLVLLPFVVRRLPASMPLIRAHWRLLFLLGLLGVATFQQLVYLALEYTTAINAAIFNSTGPIVIVAISWLMFRDRISWRQAGGIALSLVGVLAIVTRGDLATLLELEFNPGDLWALATVPVWGLYTVLLKRKPPELDSLVFLVVIAIVGVTLMAPMYAYDVLSGGRMVFTPATITTVIYMALFASVLAYIFWNSAVPAVGPNVAGLFLHLHPAFTTVLAIGFLGERLLPYHGMAIAAIVVGIYLTTVGQAKVAALTAAAPEPSATGPSAAGGAPAGAEAGRDGPRLGLGLVALITSPYLLLVLNMLFWAGNWIVGRGLRDQITPLGLNFWRWAFVLAWLLPFTWRNLWEQRQAIRRDWWVLVAMGVLAVATFNLLIYLSMASTTAINGALIAASTPVAIVLLSWLALRERISWRQGVGIALSLAGVVLIIGRGDPMRLLEVQFNAGDLWALASVPIWAVYSVLLRRRPAELGPMSLLTVLVLVGVVTMLPFALWAHAQEAQVALGIDTAAGLLYVALLASLAGVAFYNHGVARLGANVTGLFLHLVPVFTAGLAWLLLGEALELYHLAGVGLIFFGIYLTTVAGRALAKAQAAAAGAD